MNETKEDEQPALPNTLENVLSVFPLRDRKRTHHQMSESPPSPPMSWDILSAILLPDADEQLQTELERCQMEDPPPIAKRQKPVVGQVSGKLCRSGVPTVQQQWWDTGQRTLPPRTQRKSSHKTTPYTGGRRFTQARRRRRYAWGGSKDPAPAMGPVDAEFGIQLREPYSLYPFQRDVVRWLKEREQTFPTDIYPSMVHDCHRGGILNMLVGTGKSLCCLALFLITLTEQRALKQPTLLICPKTLIGNFRFEIEKFLGPDMKTLIYHREFLHRDFNRMTLEQLQSYDIILMNYETVVQLHNQPNHIFNQQTWFRVILDESHEIRNANTKRFRAVMALKAQRRFCVTATVIHNNINDIINQMRFVGLTPRTHKFKTADELELYHLDQLILFVEEEKIRRDAPLPPKHVHKTYFELSPFEKQLQRKFRRVAYERGKIVNGFGGIMRGQKQLDFVSWFIRCRQVCSAPYLLTDAAKNPRDADMTDENIQGNEHKVMAILNEAEQRQLKPLEGPAGIYSSKMQTFVALMQDQLRQPQEQPPLPRRKTVVFANWTSTLRVAIQAMCHADPQFEERHVFLHGDIDAIKRGAMITRFRTQPECDTLFMILKLGAFGLNLTEAAQVVFLEPWDTHAAMYQGEGRVHRIGQVFPVHVYYLLAKDSVEEQVYRRAMNKGELSDEVQALGGGLQKRLKFEDMLACVEMDEEEASEDS